MYRVTCILQNVPDSFEVEHQDDVKCLLEAIETELRIKHPEVNNNPRLLVLIADGLLNGLADDKTEIALGELLAASGAK